MIGQYRRFVNDELVSIAGSPVTYNGRDLYIAEYGPTPWAARERVIERAINYLFTSEQVR